MNFRSVVFTGLALLLVIGLFFIPEIVQFQKTLSGSKTTGSSGLKTLSTTQEAPKAVAPRESSNSALSRLAALVDSGYLGEDLGQTNKKAKKPSSEKVGEKSGEGTSEASLSWKSLRSKPSLDALRSVRREALEIAKSLSPDRIGSRYHLLNFASGIGTVIEGSEEGVISPYEAIRYVEYLHASATNHLAREGVDRITFQRWQGLSFGPVISSWSGRLSGRMNPFNPQLTLNRLSLQRRSIGKGSGGIAPLMVSMRGYVVGEDVRTIEVWSRRIKIESVEPRKGGQTGLRTFSIKRFQSSGPVTFRVFDDKGRVFEKVYSFYPRARIFEAKKGQYLIPKLASDTDTRLDRFFTLRMSATGTGPTGEALIAQGFEAF